LDITKNEISYLNSKRELDIKIENGNLWFIQKWVWK